MRRVAAIGLTTAGIVAAACEGPKPVLPVETSDSIAESLDASAPFVGTWRLARVERYDQTGAPLPDFVHPTIGHGKRLGYLMYDGERMAVAVQQEGHESTSGNVPAPEEALAAIERYTAYFGPYSVDAAEGYLSHQVAGSLNPRGAGGETQPFYEFLANQLILTPSLQCPDSSLTDRGCGYGTTGIQLRNVWEKVEPSTTSGTNSRFLGFWQIDRVERQTPDGREVPTPQYAQGYLTYMPSGYMAVQLMRQDRVPYKGLRPTVAEADAAMQSYVSYFGSFWVHPTEGFVAHRMDGHLNPDKIGVTTSRAFEFSNGQLVLKLPVSTVEGQEVQTSVFWDRLSAIDPSRVMSRH